YETRLIDAAGGAGAESRDPAEPLLHESVVDHAWGDYNNHMTEARYLHVFADATDAFLRSVGIDAAYLGGGHSAYTVETHLRHLHEVAGMQPLRVLTQVLGVDEKRLHLFHTMTHGRSGDTLATAEQMILHVDSARGGACPWIEPVATAIARAADAHARLPVPEGVGRAIVLPGHR
ncbi:MAG: thioesterase family protein, partial [Gaiellaceae bacterium]